MINDIFLSATKEMDVALEHLKAELSKLRTGRANITMLDDVRVSYSGSMLPLNQVATLAVPEPRLITIQPWDLQVLSEIEKAISKSNLGLTPSNDGKMIRLPIPPMTEERRVELVKQAKKYAEETKVRIRQHRRDANDLFKSQQKDGGFSEDDIKKAQERVQKMTDEKIVKTDEILSLKEKEIMKV